MSWKRTAAVVSMLALVALAAMTFGPSPVGGSARVVVSSGSSMEPGITAGDLILVRSRAHYEVGDVVAYRSDDLGTVLHRIIDVAPGDDGVEYVTQGDNNAFVDGERPTPEQMIGEMVARVPGGGRMLGLVPIFAALAVVVYWRLESARAGSRGSPAHLGPGPFTLRRVGGAGLVLAFGGLTVASAFSSPTTTRTREVSHTTRTELGWTATVEPSVLYPDGSVGVDDPVFLREVDEIDVWAEVGADGVGELSGNLRLVGILSDDSGWSHRTLLASADPSSGQAGLTGRLDLGALRTTLDLVSSRSGLAPGSTSFTLVVEGDVAGAVDGQAFEEQIDARVPFILDELVLRPEVDSEDADGDGWVHEALGAVEVEENAEARIGVSPFALPVGLARMVGPLGLLAGLVLLLWDPPEREPHEAINHRLASMVVEVESAQLPPGTPTVTVERVEDLVRLAELEGAPILYARDDAHHWGTLAMGVWYRYRLTLANADDVTAAGDLPEGTAP